MAARISTRSGACCTRCGNSDIYKMRPGGAEPIQLTTDPAGDYAPSWSPDGRAIVFHSFRHGNRDVFTMSDDGADLVRRTTGDDHELDPDWSPDGTAVVFENMTTMGAFGGFEILTLASGERRAVPIVSDFARWAPRGDLIAVHALDGLRVVSPSGGPSRLLVPNTPDEGEAFYAAWSPDGGALYYVAKTTEGSAIRAVPVAGGPSRLLVRFDDPARQHTRYGFSTDGRTFYFTVGSHESDVWVADLVR